MNALPARVTLVGAGPGDPELLTVEAVRALRRVTVVLVDDLVADGAVRCATCGERRARFTSASVADAPAHRRLPSRS